MEKGSYPGDMPPPYAEPMHGATHGPSYPYPPMEPMVKPYQPNYPSQVNAPPPPATGFTNAHSMYAQQPAYVGQTTTSVVQVVQFSNLRSRSTRLVCPHCRADVSTRVNYRTGRFTHIAALVLCLICCPCGIVPYCLEECQDAEHYCPNCQQFIGVYRR